MGIKATIFFYIKEQGYLETSNLKTWTSEMINFKACIFTGGE